MKSTNGQDIQQGLDTMVIINQDIMVREIKRKLMKSLKKLKRIKKQQYQNLKMEEF